MFDYKVVYNTSLCWYVRGPALLRSHPVCFPSGPVGAAHFLVLLTHIKYVVKDVKYIYQHFFQQTIPKSFEVE